MILNCRRVASLLLVMLLLELLSIAPLPAEEAVHHWPGFRGPLGTGVAPQADPPASWDEVENLVWKIPIPGRGSSSPVVWGDRIFLTTAISRGQQPPRPVEAPPGVSGRRRRQRVPPSEHEFIVLCLSRRTGETLWSQVAGIATPSAGTHPDNTFASASPSTDGEFVVASFGSAGLYCYDLDGNLQWKRQDLGSMTTRGGFGEGSSPALYSDWVVLPWDHEGSSYLALLDKRTGEFVWKVDRDEPTNWATPLVVQRADGTQIVHSGQRRVRGYDLKTGKELWSFSGLTQRPVASPVTFDGIAYFASSRGGAFLGAVQMDGRGDLNGTESLLWSIEKATPDIPSLLLIGDRLYFLSGNTAVMTCVEARTGTEMIGPKRLAKMRAVYASPVAAAGRIYVTGRDGRTVVLSEDLNVVSENQIDEPVDATPAIVGNQLLLRGVGHLYCFSAGPA